ncbi:thiopurine S-methyltransferase [Paraglaciecola marina]|uniref:thiopurine S-methyltransferase n=1 Tax=Paraglaciecola marina TaxID=2500157 RepID=UPI00106142B8|nr:thiopurine S-methyltransferase [Paraglaciecola marina]
MEKEYWISKWQNKELGFHQPSVNPLLESHFSKLALEEGARIFIPLCGKTLDVGWLLSLGYQVVGIEMVESAVIQLFEELQVTPNIKTIGKLKCYRAGELEIYVGDIFDLTLDILGDVDAVYDRAALVALPEGLRKKYAVHLPLITKHAKQLLISFVYDQNKMAGPPFSVDDNEVNNHYRVAYSLTLLADDKVKEAVKGNKDVLEKVWLLISNN